MIKDREPYYSAVEPPTIRGYLESAALILKQPKVILGLFGGLALYYGLSALGKACDEQLTTNRPIEPTVFYE